MIIVDTNVFVAYLNEKDKNHQRAKTIVRKILSGNFKKSYTISEVFTETATFLFKQTRRIDYITKAWNLIYTEETAIVEPIIISKEDIEYAWAVFQKYTTQKRPLSFVDCLLIAVSQSYEIDSIASFDSEFDGILKREY